MAAKASGKQRPTKPVAGARAVSSRGTASSKSNGTSSGKPTKPAPKAAKVRAAPPDDLLEKREQFIQTFFRRGAELTEELIREDEQLRSRLGELERENAALRAHVASADAIRDMLVKITQLEKEKRELVSRATDASHTWSHSAERFAEIEAENAKLASLYVASFQLHSTLDLRTIVRHLKELLAQFVGARVLALYLCDEERGQLAPIASDGVPLAKLRRIEPSQGPIGEAWIKGSARWVEGDSTRGTLEAPAACIPLRVDDRTAGVLVVYSTFEHKPSFVDVDFELFKLLGAHAAAALLAARLFAIHGGNLPSLDAFTEIS